MASSRPAVLPLDSHKEQAERIADHCERFPGVFFSADELKSACDLGSPSKVLSAMGRELGYSLSKRWRTVVCAGGKRARRAKVYRVTQRPPKAQQLSLGLAE